VLGLARAVESEGAQIFEQSKVEGYEQKDDHIDVRVGNHRVRCRQLVLADQRLRRQARAEARGAHAAGRHLHRDDRSRSARIARAA
jgi:flavin-dependent dehydrogenase